MTAIRQYLPLLHALSTSSPFSDGRETGFKSWRLTVVGGRGQKPRFPDGLSGYIHEHHEPACPDRCARRRSMTGCLRSFSAAIISTMAANCGGTSAPPTISGMYAVISTGDAHLRCLHATGGHGEHSRTLCIADQVAVTSGQGRRPASRAVDRQSIPRHC